MKYLIILYVLVLSGCSFNSSIEKSRDTSSASKPIDIAMEPANFSISYDGGGDVKFENGTLRFAPQVADQAHKTFATLVLLKESVDRPLLDFELTVDLEVVRQLRTSTPANDWEVFWLFFGYNETTPDQKTTNYFISKPQSGAELGLAHGDLGQKFLHTDSHGKTALGQRHKFRFVRSGNDFKVYRDQQLFYSFSNGQNFPQRMYENKGSIGFYSEDAEILIHSVQLLRKDSRQPASAPPSFTLGSATPMIQYTGQASSITSTVSAPLAAANLFWSCRFTAALDMVSAPQGRDCLQVGSYNSAGAFQWTPSLDQVGGWFFHVEASEVYSGFNRQTSYVQVLPPWSAGAAFIYDPQFSLSKNILGQNISVARDLASVENNNIDPWPAVDRSESINLAGLTNTSPWVMDNYTQRGVLTFDGNNDAGVLLPASRVVGSKNLRVSYWFKKGAENGGRAVVQAPHEVGVLESRYWFGVFSTRYTFSGDEVDCSASESGSDNWNFVTSQMTSGRLKTFVSGRKVCDVEIELTFPFSSPFQIGANTQGGYNFTGAISEIAGYTESSEAEIFLDFLATADRYRQVKVGNIVNADLLLHWDAANAKQGIEASSSGSANSWFDLGPTVLGKTMFGFDGTAQSGFVSAPHALVFDGLNDYVELDVDAQLSSVAAEWSIDAWIKPGVALGYDSNYGPNDNEYPLFKTIFERAHFDNPNKESHGWGLRLGADNTIDAYVVNNYGRTNSVTGFRNLDPNTWYHVVATFNKNSSVLRTYINGALDQESTIDWKKDTLGVVAADAEILPKNVKSWVGLPFDIDTRRRFNGSLGGLKVYKKTLSSAEVRRNCLAQNSRYGISCP